MPTNYALGENKRKNKPQKIINKAKNQRRATTNYKNVDS